MGNTHPEQLWCMGIFLTDGLYILCERMALTSCCMHDTFPEQICLANVLLRVWTMGLLLVAFSGKYSPRTAVMHAVSTLCMGYRTYVLSTCCTLYGSLRWRYREKVFPSCSVGQLLTTSQVTWGFTLCPLKYRSHIAADVFLSFPYFMVQFPPSLKVVSYPPSQFELSLGVSCYYCSRLDLQFISATDIASRSTCVHVSVRMADILITPKTKTTVFSGNLMKAPPLNRRGRLLLEESR